MNGRVIWITGLSGAGKTTIAGQLHARMNKCGLKSILLDGDNLRAIFKNEDFTEESYTRIERIKLSTKYGMLCETLSSQGFIVIIATVSMFEEIYAWNRLHLPNYFEIYIDVPFIELLRRDPKNIYQKFYSGIINNVAGLDIKIDEPKTPHLLIKFNEGISIEETVDLIVNSIKIKGLS